MKVVDEAACYQIVKREAFTVAFPQRRILAPLAVRLKVKRLLELNTFLAGQRLLVFPVKLS
jgi:hypothetical protein